MTISRLLVLVRDLKRIRDDNSLDIAKSKRLLLIEDSLMRTVDADEISADEMLTEFGGGTARIRNISSLCEEADNILIRLSSDMNNPSIQQQILGSSNNVALVEALRDDIGNCKDYLHKSLVAPPFLTFMNGKKSFLPIRTTSTFYSTTFRNIDHKAPQ